MALSALICTALSTLSACGGGLSPEFEASVDADTISTGREAFVTARRTRSLPGRPRDSAPVPAPAPAPAPAPIDPIALPTEPTPIAAPTPIAEPAPTPVEPVIEVVVAAAPPVAPVPTPVAVAATPALTPSGPIVAKTGQTIRGLKISNPSGSCIVVPTGVSNVTIEDNEIGPCGSGAAGDWNKGYGVELVMSNGSITVRRNQFHDVSSGVQSLAATGNVIIERNRFTRLWGGPRGYAGCSQSQCSSPGTFYPRGSAVQFDGHNGPGTRVSCNVVDALADGGSIASGDLMSAYKSQGTADSLMEFAYNRLRGGTFYNGSGLILGDSGGRYFNVHHNVIHNVANVGIGNAGAGDSRFEDNLIYQRGETAASLTGAPFSLSLAGSVGAQASQCVRNVIARNRAWGRNWAYNLSGDDSVGLYDPNECTQTTYTANVWIDPTLSATSFDVVPAACAN